VRKRPSRLLWHSHRRHKRWSQVARDITERKEAERLRRLLTEELNHRVKNTLAIIQAIATQSLRRAKSPVDFVSSFTGRV